MNLGGTNYSIPQFLIGVVVVAACIALTMLALSVFGIGVPSWVVTACWIVVVALAIVFAIRVIAGAA